MAAQDNQDPPQQPDPSSDEKAEHQHEGPDPHSSEFFDTVDVTQRGDDLLGIAGSSNEGTTGKEDLETRPKLRAGELVETVPGAIATQHSGGGKANQYFLRGFNLDHGTDFAIIAGGMPVNMPTHGHGQGYADLNFLIPELVERAHYRKGPYFAEVGDFSAAGGVISTSSGTCREGMATLTSAPFPTNAAWSQGSIPPAEEISPAARVLPLRRSMGTP